MDPAIALKLFLAEAIVPAVVKAWRAVQPPGCRLLPVGGITPGAMAAYLDAGASGFGLGSALCRPGDTPEKVRASAGMFVQRLREICRPS